MSENWYTVWRRRPDGLVGASAQRGISARSQGDGLTLRSSSFTELLVTQDWAAAHALIRAEREAAKGYGNVWYCHGKELPCRPELPHEHFCGWRFEDEVVITGERIAR